MLVVDNELAAKDKYAIIIKRNANAQIQLAAILLILIASAVVIVVKHLVILALDDSG